MSQRADIWRHVRRGKPFTIGDLMASVGCSRHSARPYVHALARAELIKRVDFQRGRETTYQLANDPGPETPRFDRRSGQVRVNTSARYRVWQAARVLRRFTVTDLKATAESGHTAAARYIQALLAVRYVIVTRECDRNAGTRRHYQLIRDPGPLPLRHCVADNTLTDPNTGEVFQL